MVARNGVFREWRLDPFRRHADIASSDFPEPDFLGLSGQRFRPIRNRQIGFGRTTPAASWHLNAVVTQMTTDSHAILLSDMDPEENLRLRRKRANLSGLKDQLTEQDEILKGVQHRSQPWQGAPESVMEVMRHLFRELTNALPEKKISFDDNNDIDGLRSQISSVRSKVQSALAAIYEDIGQLPPETNPERANEAISIKPSEATDKRRVFVVHGRNVKTKDAMFAFLRAIDLAPIEWEEAIHMTGGTAPYMGNILDIAFSRAQAAIILITGDDIACLGEQFVETHDLAHERQLTPQARPNVIFEMGMAFGKYPDRTLIVEFGHTRPFSDVTGRNTIHFTDNSQSRTKIADRLRNAGCLVRTDNRSDWLTVGDFSLAFQLPIHTPPVLKAAQETIDTLKAEIQKRDEEIIILRRDFEQREQKLIHQIADLEQTAELEAEQGREDAVYGTDYPLPPRHNE